MVVLLDAYPTYIAVVASLRVLIFTNEAYFFNGPLVVILQQGLHPFGLVFGILAEQGDVVGEHNGHEGDLGVEDDVICETDEEIDDGQVDDEGDYEQQRNCVFSSFGSVFNFDVAVKFEHITYGVGLIQHSCDGFKLAFLCNVQGNLALIILDVSVGSSDQQPADHSGVAVGGCQHQRCVAFHIPDVEEMPIGGLGQDIGHYLFAVGVGRPVQGTAFKVVQVIEVDCVLEVEKGHDDVLLGREVEGIEAGVGFELGVCSLFYEVLDDLEVTAEGGVEKGGVPFVISVVDPVFKFLVVSIFNVLVAADPFGFELNFPDVDFDEFEVTFKGELVQEVVALAVDEGDYVNGGVAFKILLELFDTAVEEELVDDLAGSFSFHL